MLVELSVAGTICLVLFREDLQLPSYQRGNILCILVHQSDIVYNNNWFQVDHHICFSLLFNQPICLKLVQHAPPLLSNTYRNFLSNCSNRIFLQARCPSHWRSKCWRKMWLNRNWLQSFILVLLNYYVIIGRLYGISQCLCHIYITPYFTGEIEVHVWQILGWL